MSKILNFHIPAEQKNFAINGALDFWQQNGSNVITVNTATTTTGYSADMLAYNSVGATTKNYSLQRSTDVPTFSQSGFQSIYSNLFTMITGIPSMAAGDIIQPNIYKMEGLDYAKLHGRSVTVGFWVKASVAGIYSASFRNASANRSYVTTFTISLSNTWEFKAIPLTMDNSGTWAFDNTLGLFVEIGSCGGSTFTTSTLNQWQAGNFLVASTANNFMGTTGATLRVSQISIVEGSLGFGPTGFQRAGKDVQAELAMCQRYLFAGSFAAGCVADSAALIVMNSPFYLPVQLRTTPTLTSANFSSLSFSGFGNAAGLFDSPLTFSAQISSSVNYFQIRTNNPNSRAIGSTGTMAGTAVIDARL